MGYEDSVLDEVKIRAYARRVAAQLRRASAVDMIWVDKHVTEDVWVEETVMESRWGGLRKVPVTHRVLRPRTTTTKVQVPRPGPTRWLLAQGPRSVNRSSLGRGGYGEEVETTHYYLRADGELIREWEYRYGGMQGGRYFQGSQEEHTTTMSDADMLWFDRGRGGKVWAPSKGVGLHARLTKLRNTGQ